MDESSSTSRKSEWHLAGQRFANHVNDLSVQRPLSVEEAKEVVGASTLIGRLTENSKWNPVQVAWVAFAEIANRPANNVDVQVLNHRAYALIGGEVSRCVRCHPLSVVQGGKGPDAEGRTAS